MIFFIVDFEFRNSIQFEIFNGHLILTDIVKNKVFSYIVLFQEIGYFGVSIQEDIDQFILEYKFPTWVIQKRNTFR